MEKDEKQLSLLDEHTQADNTPVVCLDMTFENDEARREYFRNELRKKLPELKEIEGFPIGEDEDIIALSDPPYYTACPNPWINDFIIEWEREKVEKYGRDVNEEYHREPFATDISEGKTNDVIYNAHSYHTKTPHKAIMRFLLNYTNPGDVVFDGFAGTGMTGVAAEMCGSKKEVESLGYKVLENGSVLKESGNELVKDEGLPFSKLGERKTILSELSSAATFIGYNYNTDVNPLEFERDGRQLLDKIERDLGWLYCTIREETELNIEQLMNQINNVNSFDRIGDIISKYKEHFGKVKYIVWSEVLQCPNCGGELVFYESMLDKTTKKAINDIVCPHCSAETSKKSLGKTYVTKYDQYLNTPILQSKRIPVLINYTVGKERRTKVPDKFDLFLIDLIANYKIPYWFPTDRMREGSETRRNDPNGVTHVHHFYTDKTLLVSSYFLSNLIEENKAQYVFLHGSVLPKLTKLNRYMPQHAGPKNGSRELVGPMANTLYLPPLSVENNVIEQLNYQMKKIVKALNTLTGNVISTQSSTSTQINDNSVDYIFLDPPFGANIMYSELNFIRESWLKIITNNNTEAIESKAQRKTLVDYQQLITRCFAEAYRILKPGRWMTVEFSNTQASVWNVIQHCLQKVGFIVASVDMLNKTRGGLHSMIGTTAVKQDLIISAYKPSKYISMDSSSDDESKKNVWDFIDSHLQFIPIFKERDGQIDYIHERDPRILYDRTIAYFISNGFAIPMSSSEFQKEISKKYPIRDGMVFLDNQVTKYDKKRIYIKEFIKMNLFVIDENTAIEWIRQQLLKKPQVRQDLHPNYMKEIQHISKHELLPELDDLLHQNFLRYEGDEGVPDQIVSYLRRNYKDLRGLDSNDSTLIEKAMNRWYVPDPNKQADLEKLREKALLREFNGYVEELEGSKKKLQQFRTEAIRAGFKKAYSEKEFEQIVKVGDRLPEKIIQEDDKLLMYYDNACIRLGL
ncbi:DNA methyltransferase [Bacillus rhizoplanae]|uniref:DNA methyltransferase n=1 Tax=Bacillus rhizoplanae TaxID=2880966 RepID=UPI003D1CD779